MGYKYWVHNTSTDLLRWKPQDPLPQIGGIDGGSISVTEAGGGALWGAMVDGKAVEHHPGLLRAVPSGAFGPDAAWQPPARATTPGIFPHTSTAPSLPSLGMGFRDPNRAVKMPDGAWYVAVGSGHGGTNNVTTAPTSGTGCVAWMRATDSTLTNFTFVGCLLEITHMTGHIDGKDHGTVVWRDEDAAVSFVECPDVFPMGDKWVALVSLW